MTSAPRTAGEMLAQISNGLVQLHTRYYGKGPTKAKSYLVDDTIICMLEEGFTTVERTLIEGGRSGAVHDIRRTFQQAMEEQFTMVVEEATGRKVIAYMSQVHVDPDLAVELFMLSRPLDGAGADGDGNGDGAIEKPLAAVAVLDPTREEV
jgi:uncharacterized protein YbcI